MTPEEFKAHKAALENSQADKVRNYYSGQMVEFTDRWLEQYRSKFKNKKYPIESVDSRNALVWIKDDFGRTYGVYPSWLKSD